MDAGYIVVMVFGVLVLLSVMVVTVLTLVLRGIRGGKGETVQWPVSLDAKQIRSLQAEERAAAIGRAGTQERGGDERPEWTAQELAGDDLRPVGTHDEKHVLPGKAHWR